MSKYAKILDKILKGRSDENISFDDLRGLLLHLGFEERTSGSHHIFRITVSLRNRIFKKVEVRQNPIRLNKSET